MAESCVKDFKSKYLASIQDGFRGMKERSYPSLRPLQINRGERDTIPYSGTLLESAEVSRLPGRYRPESVQDLFVPGSDGFVPQTLVLVGPPGAGKTTISQKILADWASGKFYADRFSFVLRLTGRGINQIAGDISLTGLVANACQLECSDEVIGSIFSDPSKVLLIIDGFDELRWTLEDEGEDWEEPFQATHKEALLRGLLRREVLENITLLLTSRTSSLKQMDYVSSPSVIQLPGFTRKDLEEYFQGFFQEKNLEEQALAVLKENPALSHLCAVPLTCWLVATIVKAGMMKELGSAQCKTLSSVYLLYLQGLLRSSRTMAACLKKLCALANQGVLDHKSLFDEGDLESHRLSQSEVACILCRDEETPNRYSFLHRSIQEFLAALYYVLEEPEIKGTTGSRDPFLPRICTGTSLCDQAEKLPQLLPAVRFLFGLFNHTRVHEVARVAGCSPSLRAKAAMENWLLAGKAPNYSTDAICCFYEAQDEELRARAFNTEDLHFAQCFYSGVMADIPTRELLYCTCNALYRSIALEDYMMRPEDLELLSPLFHGTSKLTFTRCGFAEEVESGEGSSWLANPNSQIKEAGFHVCVVAASFFRDLGALLSSSQSLARLSLSHQILDDAAMIALCAGLRHPGCRLQELILDDCNLIASSCEELGASIHANQSLHKLELALNQIQDAGFKALCQGLQGPGCSMKELRVDFSELSPACGEDLRSLLMTNQSLRALSLRDAQLQDAGAKLICQGLLHPTCPLQELRLNECKLTSSSCEDFRSVLRGNGSLRVLDLTYNQLEDAGVAVLCEALRDPACTLQELILLHCELSASCCSNLAAAISASRSLTKLDLTWNGIQDAGATALCEALRNPNCPLQVLRLSGCELTRGEDIASAIKTNRSLTTLDLSGNQFGDSAIQPLCQALRRASCTLREIRVGDCDMTPACAEELLAVINTNCSLREVDVSFTPEGAEPSADRESVCARLRHPACTLEKNETQDGTFVYFKYCKQ